MKCCKLIFIFARLLFHWNNGIKCLVLQPPVGHRRNGSAPSFGADGLDGSAHSVASTRPMLYTDAPVFYPDANGRTPGEDLPENGTLQNGFSALRQLSSAAVDVASNLPRLAANKVNFAVMRGELSSGRT